MKDQVLVKRYTQGLVSSLKDEKEFTEISLNLHHFKELLSKQKNLSEALTSPFLPASKKTQIAEDILEEIEFGEKVSRFILLLVEKDRLGLLPDILDFLPEFWNEENGISTIEVSSVIPLTESQKMSLEEKLERIEKRPVFLKYKKDPRLIGGLSIRKGNIIYDISIKGQIERLKEKICEG